MKLRGASFSVRRQACSARPRVCLPSAPRRPLTFRSRPRRSSTSGSARVRRRLLLHPGHRYLHQARRLSPRRRHLQRRRPWPAGVERRPRGAEPLRDTIRRPFAHGADGRYPDRHRIWHGPHLRRGRVPVHHPGRRHRQPGQLHRLAECSAPTRGCSTRRAKAMSPSWIPLPPVRGFHLRQVGVRLCNALAGHARQHHVRSCWAATRPTTPDPTTSSTRRNSATACRPRSALTIPSFGTVPPSTIWSLPLNATLDTEQRLCRRACARNRRQRPCRPGLGPVPDFGRRPRGLRLLQSLNPVPSRRSRRSRLVRRARAEHAVGNLRPSRHQVGRRRDGRAQHQEPADRDRRRHQDGCELRQGRYQVRHRDRCGLAELRHVRRLVARLSEHRLRCDHRCGLPSDGVRRRRLAASDRGPTAFAARSTTTGIRTGRRACIGSLFGGAL